ncbi:MAG: SDR family oxidoreductase [Gordonia sp. (in: high G+C Gram-positive bacteria)]
MRLLVTGATGVVGSAVVDRLLKIPGVDVSVLTRGTAIEGVPAVNHVLGDLQQTQLGLSLGDYRGLTMRIDRIVHIASVVDFDADPDVILNTNVGGAAGMAQLAQDAGAELLYVSTSYTAKLMPGARVRGAGCVTGRNAYLASKAAGDTLVSAAGVPFQIAKPSILIGDSQTGEIRRLQGLHTFIRAFLSGAMPFFPGTEDTLIDFIPVDVVADRVVELALKPTELDGSTSWLTAGESAPTVNELCRWIGDATGSGLPSFRFMSVDTVQRLIVPAFLGGLGDRDRRRFENLLALTALFDDNPFQSSPDAVGNRVEKETLRRSVAAAVKMLEQPRAVTVSA